LNRFVDPSNAKEALAEMNGFELAGRQIRVGLGNDKFTPESTASLLRTFNQQMIVVSAVPPLSTTLTWQVSTSRLTTVASL
jgi:RNA recognition motif-containing protein